MVSGLPQGSVLWLLSFLLYTSEFFNMIGSHIVGYENDTTIYSAFPRLHSRSQVMESLNQDFAAINSWCLKWHMKLKPKKDKIYGS